MRKNARQACQREGLAARNAAGLSGWKVEVNLATKFLSSGERDPLFTYRWLLRRGPRVLVKEQTSQGLRWEARLADRFFRCGLTPAAAMRRAVGAARERVEAIQENVLDGLEALLP